MNKKIPFFILLLIVSVALLLRFYRLGEIPAGMHADAASQAYNAFSILHSGKDQYGQFFPILFRANGSYQPPLYTYLSITSITIFGNTIFAAHFLSALAGILLVVITFFFCTSTAKTRMRFTLGLLAGFIIATSPWSIFFSRLVVEANLSVLIFVSGVTLLVLSLKRIRIFPVACFILGLSTHSYYSEQIIILLFLPLFIYLFRKYFVKNKISIVIGLGIFFLLQLPHLITIQSGAFSRRFSQVSYILNQSETSNQLIRNFLSGIIRFLNQYLSYFMPNNLFLNYNPSLGRTIPDMGVFYSWFIIPFILGIRDLIKKKQDVFSKIILLLLIITPIPAGLTGDQFYPLRTLSFLWTISIVIALGIYNLFSLFKTSFLKLLLFSTIFLYSLFSFYISYFILYKYENPQSSSYGYPYIKLINYLPLIGNKHIIIDSTRDIGIGLRVAYLTSYNPKKMQDQLRPQLKSLYYSNIVNTGEIYNIENIEIKPVTWSDTCKENTIIIGDLLSISDQQTEEYQLKKEFEINDITGKPALKIYSTQPRDQCQKSI